MKSVILFYLLAITVSVKAQTFVQGTVVDGKTNQPVDGATVILYPENLISITDTRGHFLFKNQIGNNSKIQIIAIGYESHEFTSEDIKNSKALVITPKQILLADVLVTHHSTNPYKPISKVDIAMRGVNNSQEVLRIIPGIVIGQHQGGGKAEQIFLRGFDADHGTDFRMDVDGMPINMVSHAHGQGFGDSHFIIPETIESVDFKKGPYSADKGDFATTGFVDFNTKTALSENTIKLEGGMFNTWRALGMVNLLDETAKAKQQSWYVASEYRYSDAYFNNPQHFKRFNLFTRYTGRISKNTTLTASASTFWSKWDASGQIPDRAVASGLIGFYGAIDPYEGGLTYRTNANVELSTGLNNGAIIKNRVYYSNSHFDLHTNFTFYLVDSINGDEIRQTEGRDMMGYNGSYHHSGYVGNTRITTDAGVQIRLDKTHNSELSHTVDRYITLGQIKLGDITELSISPYVSETIHLNKRFTINAGLRFDQYEHKYLNKFAGDTTLPGIGLYKASAHTFSPKLNLYYQANDNTQFYLTCGKGFHSNDTRAVVVENGFEVLPSAYSSDFGIVFKPVKSLLINAAAWYIFLKQEFVYSGDGGDVSFNGRTQRYGFDFSTRFQPKPFLYFDVDVNYAHGRSIDGPKGTNYIPLAPVWTSTGGITYGKKIGFNGSLRYRYTGDRPGNEDYSITAKGYFICDAVFNYTRPKYEIGLIANNFFNTKWKETQFDTETRLKGEPSPVDEICFTPGTPVAIRIQLTFKF